MGKAELTILDGERRGERFEFAGRIFSIGRSSNNDIVLSDHAVSSRHCEVLSLGGNFFIVDKKSRNGTWLNGREIERAQLLSGDKIGVGDTTFVFAPLERKLHRVRLSLSDAVSRKSAAFVLLSAAVLGAFFLALKYVRDPVKIAEGPPIFELNLVEEKGDSEKLVRSQIDISAEGSMRFYFDALGEGRHFYREVKLSPVEIQSLQKKVRDSGLFSESYPGNMSQPRAILLSAPLLTISVRLGSLEKEASFYGDLPESVAFVKEELYMLRDRKFSFPSLTLSRNELVEKAQEAFSRGKFLYDEREGKSGNLFGSICAFKEALVFLETVEPKPDFYLNVEEYLYRSCEKLELEFGRLRFQVEKAIRLMQWERARDNLEKLLAKIPDKTDKRYKYAITRLAKVRKRCKRIR